MTPAQENARLYHLDATRAFALVLGIVFHASLSFVPVFMGWAVQDVSTSPLVTIFTTVSHSFRMETFFLLAGFFSHMMLERKGTISFLRTRVLRIVVPFVIGWFLLRPLLVSGWLMGNASLRGDVPVWSSLLGGWHSLAALPAGVFTGSHLWFLYYLALITSVVLVIRGILNMTGSWQARLIHGADGALAWLAKSPFALLILALPTAATLWCMSSWGMDTPDKSLLPHVPALAIYGGFFAFGWLLERQRGLLDEFSRLTLWRVVQAGIGITAILLLGGIERDPAHTYYVTAHVAFAAGYAMTMWSLVFLTIGLFHKLCPQPNALVRYVADSSYWMYLIHLPLVIWLQVAFAELPFNWLLKLATISAIAVVIALVTYDLFARSTFIGWLLNGRRSERVIVPRAREFARRLLLNILPDATLLRCGARKAAHEIAIPAHDEIHAPVLTAREREN